MTRSTNRGAMLAAGGLGLLVGQALRHRLMSADLTGQVALVTGSSRGLGLLLAREFLREGCKVVICARDGEELERAATALREESDDIMTYACDVSDEGQVQAMIAEATRHFGQVDILVNNAGVIEVGPVQTMTARDFGEAMNAIFWGTVHPTLAVLPQMRTRQTGRIVNIGSIGGKISMPHLLPYNSAKFAVTGFSEGLRAELASDGIIVTTITPGELRTGSYAHATFKGDTEREFGWFSLSDNLPFNSMDAERAAKVIVEATKRGEAERILTLPAVVASVAHGVAPGLTTDVLALVNRYGLPSADDSAQHGAGDAPEETAESGEEIEPRKQSPLFNGLLGLGKSANRRFNQRGTVDLQ